MELFKLIGSVHSLRVRIEKLNEKINKISEDTAYIAMLKISLNTIKAAFKTMEYLYLIDQLNDFKLITRLEKTVGRLENRIDDYNALSNDWKI